MVWCNSQIAHLIGHGSRYVKITFKQSSESDVRGRPKLVGTMEDLNGGLALRKELTLPQM